MEYMTYTINGVKWVPQIQAEIIRRERDAALIANKNLTTMLELFIRSNRNVDNGAE